MTHLILTVLLSMNAGTTLDIQVALSKNQQLPTAWVALDDLKEVEIGESYWVKVTVPKANNNRYVLKAGNWYMNNVKFYDDELNLINEGNRITLDRQKGVKTLYLYYPFPDAKDPDLFSIQLYDLESFLLEKSKKDIFQASFHSILIFILCISIFFAVRNRDIVYRNYAYYIGSILLFFSYQYGILENVLPFVKGIPPSWIWVLSASISHAYLLFTMSFLDLETNDPFNYKVALFAQYFIYLVVITESIALLFEYDIMHQLWYKSMVIVIELGIMAVFIYRIATMRTIISNIYIVGASVLLISSITGQIASTFKIAYETNLIVQSGLVMDLFVLSIGIAVRVGLIQKSKQETQASLIKQLQVNEQLQLEYTDKLESKVTQRTEALNQRNKENETLLKEVHHRVKNNLQMITSLLNMQQRRLKEKEAKDALALTKNRVKSIGLIHEYLYKHDDFTQINIRDYIEELVFILISSLYRGSNKIKTTIEVGNLMADIETAIPIGLILNELVTNSIKYAFNNNSKPQLKVSLRKSNDELILDVIDNGGGLDMTSEFAGFGNTIINTLLENHDGSMKYPKSADHFHVQVILKNFKVNQVTEDVDSVA